MTYLLPILGDQLSLNLASLKFIQDQKVIIVMAEVREETDYAPHHRQKIWFLFAAMRHFAKKLEALGYQVHYSKIDDPKNTQSLIGEWERLAKHYDCKKIVLTEAGEWRLMEAIEAWQLKTSLELSCLEDSRFLCSHQDFLNWAKGRKQLRMEYFYQYMRKTHQILVDEKLTPVGGKWNFDQENRSPLKQLPPNLNRWTIYQDQIIDEVKELVASHFPENFGDLEQMYYAVTAEQAEIHFLEFLKTSLPLFGQYQDVMVSNQPYLYHAVISAYINVGFLDPLKVCQAAQDCYVSGQAPLNAVEGFIRQVLGWREYVRGIYWMQMPSYQNLNYFDANRKLPQLYWGGATKMNCLASVVSDTKKYAYSHHIQRLMITGNFALLAGLSPAAVCDWYLGVYIDAYEWVELPNTLGMALFADGGIMASKPYAASAKYIDKMSNFCEKCYYNPNELLGDKACPFNALYWNFIASHETLLSGNQRMAYMLSTWRRFSPSKQDAIKAQAKQHLLALEQNQL
jgi:deoxyribodipyrimidine photolyase-related protein